MKKPAVALITGAARRVGAAITEELHASGFNVVIHCNHSQAQANDLNQALNTKRSNSACVIQSDLTGSSADFSRFIRDVATRWGCLDVLVNNASIFYPTNLDDVGFDQWDELININARAPFFLAQAATPYLQKDSGCIVNICDIHGARPMQDYAIYSISKAALIMQTKVLAKELAPKIRVNGVSPGAVVWPEGVNTLSESLKKQIIESIPLKRHGNPTDIANAVRFLVQDADYITGQNIVVDGGRSI